MNISFDKVKNHFIKFNPDDIDIRMVVFPTTIGDVTYLFGAPDEGHNITPEIYEYIKELPDVVETDVDISLHKYVENDSDQVFLCFSPEHPELVVLDPCTQEKTEYPISFAQFKDAFMKYYESGNAAL